MDLAALDHLRETLAVAHCTKCDRSAELTTVDGTPWCGWCGGETTFVLRRVRTLREEVAAAHVAGDQVVDPEQVPLQPLRVTEGWRVAYNNGLYALQPTEHTVKWWWLFKQDMLTLVHEGRNRLLDVGWSDEMNPQGCYRLTLVEGDFAGKELHAYETRDLHALVAEIERILEWVTNGRL